MAKNYRSRLGYRKTYSKSYKPYYKKSYSKYRSGRHRISRISKTYRVQKVSKVLGTDQNITLVPNAPFAIYNGKYLKTKEIAEDQTHIYKELASKLPVSLYAAHYEHLTSDSGIVNPTLKLKDTKITCSSTSTTPVSIVSLHEPLLAHYAFARDLQKLIRFQEFPSEYLDYLSVVVYNSVGGTYKAILSGELVPADRTIFATFVNDNRAEFIEHFVSVLVGVDPKAIFKQVVMHDVASGTFRLFPISYYQLVSNKLDLKRLISRNALSSFLAGDQLETAINNVVSRFSDLWEELFDKVYTHPYPGITSGCLGLNDNEKKVFTQWLASIFKQGYFQNVNDGTFFANYLTRHKAGDLTAEVTSATNAIASVKLVTIRHLYGDKPTLYDYRPTKSPNVLLVSCHTGSSVPMRVRQEYKFSSALALKNIRLALYNNPDMMSYLSEQMRDYISKAFPEIRLYKEGQKHADRLRRMGRQ